MEDKLLLIINALLYALFLCLCGHFGVNAQYNGIVREYCKEKFNPTCTEGEVIVMQHAHYGRMQIGRCMKDDYGLPSCSVDVIKEFHKLCSGKTSCQIDIPYPDMTASLGCIKDLSPYLEASYKCLKVYVPKRDRCRAPERIVAHKKSAYLSSKTSLQTFCGVHESPWILEAKPGQQIELTLIDLSWTNNSESRSRCPLNYGYILNMDSDDVIKICGGIKAEQILYSSVGHRIQIVLEMTSVQNYNFIIKFQAFGCPDYTTPKHSWVQKENDSLSIGCEYSTVTWKLKCVDNIWLGIVGNCTPPPVPVQVQVHAPEDSIPEYRMGQSEEYIPSVSNNHVAVFTMGCLTMVVCCCIVVMGMLCTKRYEVRIVKQKHQLTSSARMPINNDNTIGTNTMMFKTINFRDSIPPEMTELPPYSFPVSKKDRAPDIPRRQLSMTRDSRNIRESGTESDYLNPQNGDVVGGDDEDNSVLYYVLENPSDGVTTTANMSEEMYQSIHLNSSLSSNKA